jgi:hypothetical protein
MRRAPLRSNPTSSERRKACATPKSWELNLKYVPGVPSPCQGRLTADVEVRLSNLLAFPPIQVRHLIDSRDVGGRGSELELRSRLGDYNQAMRRLCGLSAFLCGLALWGCGEVLPSIAEKDGAPGVEDGASDEGGEGGHDGDATDDGDASAVDAMREVGVVDVMRDISVDMRLEASSDAIRDVSNDPQLDSSGDARDADGPRCPTPVDCANAACNGASCDATGRVCSSSMCTCPGGLVNETTCADGADNDCDGLKDCADPDCLRAQCGASTNQRCCGTTCVDTETDPKNCQGCGTACAAGQMCRRISDGYGVRGTCTCANNDTQCARDAFTLCRTNNPDGLNNLCACDVVQPNSPACAEGQTCVDVLNGPNFCRY